MRLRFSAENWAKFAQGKDTTIRTKKLKDGVYDAIGGSRFKPVVLGKVKITYWFALTGGVCDLFATGFEHLPKHECFHCKMCLAAELLRLSPKQSPHDPVFVHKAKVVERK